VTDSPLFVNSWSSEGDRLAVTRGLAPGIGVYSMRDRTFEMLTVFGMWPVWLYDSRRLIFTGSSAQAPLDDTLYILDIQSKQWHVIHTLPQGSFSDGLTVSPDNRAIYYPHVTVEADLWLLSLR
jgi:hypothetical protein